jgi:hypothetical protein
MVKKKNYNSKKRKKSVRRPSLNPQDLKTEKILIDNFVALQRVMTNLSEKFDNLAVQISKMLNLFELSAKALAEKEFNTERDNKDVRKVVEKLDGLLEQNKTIAKGLLVLHEDILPNHSSEQPQEEQAFSATPAFIPKPAQVQLPVQLPIQTQNVSSEKYQKSISSEAGELQPPRFKPLPR